MCMVYRRACRGWSLGSCCFFWFVAFVRDGSCRDGRSTDGLLNSLAYRLVNSLANGPANSLTKGLTNGPVNSLTNRLANGLVFRCHESSCKQRFDFTAVRRREGTEQRADEGLFQDADAEKSEA